MISGGGSTTCTVVCRNCGKPLEYVNRVGGYWKHAGRDIGSAWCDESATRVGPRAEPIAGEAR